MKFCTGYTSDRAVMASSLIWATKKLSTMLYSELTSIDNTIGRDIDSMSRNTGLSFMKVSFIVFLSSNNRVGGNSSDWGISDLSHHRSCGSASGGSTNLTYDTPFGVVITHGD